MTVHNGKKSSPLWCFCRKLTQTRVLEGLKKKYNLTFRESGSSPGGLAQNSGTPDTHHHGLGVAEHGGDFVASGALDIHEIRIRVLDQTLQLVFAFLILGTRVQEVFRELKCKSNQS